MSHSGNSGIGPPSGDTGRNHYRQYEQQQYQQQSRQQYHQPGGDNSHRQHARSPGVEHQYYALRSGELEEHSRRTSSGKYPEENHRRAETEKGRHSSRHSSQYEARSSSQQQPQQTEHRQQQQGYAPTTGQMRSGHLELDSLYSGDSGPVQVNSMNAPNNSTVQCGCENIDCPFCNLMLSVELSLIHI